MILDSLDIKILRKSMSLGQDEKKKIWQWTLEFFPQCKTKYQRTAKYNLIISRITSRLKDFFEKENGDYVLLDNEYSFVEKISKLKYKDILASIEGEKIKVYRLLKTF